MAAEPIPVTISIKAVGADELKKVFTGLENDLKRLANIANEASTAANRLRDAQAGVAAAARANGGQMAQGVGSIQATDFEALRETMAGLVGALRDAQSAFERASAGAGSLGNNATNAGQNVNGLNNALRGAAPAAQTAASTLDEAADGADNLQGASSNASPDVERLAHEIGQLNTVASEIGKLQNLAQPILSFARSATEASGEFEQLEKKIEISAKSVERASEVFDAAKKMSASSPFDTKGIASAAASLEKLGKVSEEYLPAVADLAAGTGKSIEETAAAVSQAFSGSAEDYKKLAESYGFSVAQLSKYGAVLDENGELLLENNQQATAARDAFMKLAEVDYAGAAQRQADTFQGSMQAAKNSIDNLKSAVGESFVPLVKDVASGVGSLADAIASLPTPITGAVAQIAVLGAGAISAAAGFVKLINGVRSVGRAFETFNGLRAVSSIGGLTTAVRATTTAFGSLAARIGLTAGAAGGLLTVFGILALVGSNYYANQIEAEKERGRALEESTHKAAKLANALREVNLAKEGQKGESLSAAGVTRGDLEKHLKDLEKERVGLNEQLKNDPEFKGMGDIGSYEFMDKFATRKKEEIKRIERDLNGLEQRKQKGEDVEHDIAAAEENLHITRIRHINEEYKVAVTLWGKRYEFEEAREEKLSALRDGLNIDDEKWNKLLSAGQDTAYDPKTGLNLSARLRSVNGQIEETKKALSSLDNEEDRKRQEEAKKRQEEAKRKLDQINKQATQRQKASDLSLLEEELGALEQNFRAGAASADELKKKYDKIHEARMAQIEEEFKAEEEALKKAGADIAPAVNSKKAKENILAVRKSQYYKKIEQETADLKERKNREEKQLSEEQNKKNDQKQLDYLQNNTVIDSKAPLTDQLKQLRHAIGLYKNAVDYNKELLKTSQARAQAQNKLTALVEREKELAEQLAEIQKRADEQNKSLEEALLEEELSTLEQLKSADEKVEAEIAAKRDAIHQIKLQQIETEKDEQIKAGVEIEKAEEIARNKRAILDEQEKRRKLAELAELKKASETKAPEKTHEQTAVEKAQAEYSSIKEKNRAKGIMSFEDFLAEENARGAVWRAKANAPLGEADKPASLTDSAKAAAASVSGLSNTAQTATESLKTFGDAAAAVSNNVSAGSGSPSTVAGGANDASKPDKVTSGNASATPGSSKDATKTATTSSASPHPAQGGGLDISKAIQTASESLASFSADMSTSAQVLFGSLGSLDNAASSAASALVQLAASAQVQSVPTASTPVAMPTPEAMGAVNPSVLGASSLESGGGSTTNTTNNFYMDNVQASQNVNTDQIARAVQTLMDSEDAWRKMYLGPWR